MSGALIGGVLLALVTSLPELITTLTSTIHGTPSSSLSADRSQ
ncbi:MAG: hypothetical protein R6V86_06585, partial [Spirochaetia bacterium]